MITATLTNGRVYFDAPPTWYETIKDDLPGSLWDKKAKQFHAPASLAILRAARGVLGDALVLDEELNTWAWAAREDRDIVLGAKEAPIMPWSLFDERLDDYQKVGAGWLLTVERGVLADEMRMGKMIQALAALAFTTPAYAPRALPALIVCPGSVKFTWEAEARTWAPDLKVSVITGTKAQQAKALAAEADIYVLSWSLVAKLSRLAPYGSTKLTDTEKTEGPLNRIGLRTVVMDEMHRMKNPTTKWTRAAWYLAHRATYRWGLTGTPITDTPADVWPLMYAIAPEEYPVGSAYVNRYCTTREVWGRPGGGVEVTGLNPATKDEFFSFFDPRFLRREKGRYVSRVTLEVEMGPVQAKAYRSMQDHMLADLDTGILAATDPLTCRTRMLQLAAATPVLDDEDGKVTALKKPSCKVDALLEVIEERAGKPIVVFAESRKLIELVASVLDGMDVPFGLVTGAVPDHQRFQAVQRFQEGDLAVMLCTIAAGGEGITLNRARTAVFLQRHYRYELNLQADARIAPPRDQVWPVEIIDIITRDTAEYRVHEIGELKDGRAQEVVRDAREWLT